MDELTRRIRTRIAQPRLGKVKPTTYKKFLGRHEHRVKAEEILNRKLRSGEIVHHKDGNKHNNSSDNLEIITQSEHIKEHRKVLKLARRKQADKITHCPSGHQYTKENTYLYPDKRRCCITCRKAAFHKWKIKKLGLINKNQ